MPYKNHSDQLAAQRRHYQENLEFYRDRNRTRRQDLSRWIAEMKSTLTCERCPENHPACIDFHHQDPTKKEVNIGEAFRLGYSKKRIEAEMEKCIVLCSNCHRKLHYQERQQKM